MLKMAYIATRPAVLVYVRRNEKRVKGPCIGEDDSDEDEEDNKESRRVQRVVVGGSGFVGAVGSRGSSR